MTSTDPSQRAVSAALSTALLSLEQALDAPRRAGIPLGNWRWVVRQRLASVREALVEGSSKEGWLAARGGAAFTERNQLLARLGSMSGQVLETTDVEAIRLELKRLVSDLAQHVRRLDDPSRSG